MNMRARSKPPGSASAARARYRIVHATRYLYSEAVPLCQNELHVRPRDTARQTCLTHRLVIEPMPVRVEECRDYFGNPLQFFTIHDRHMELAVTAHTAVELRAAERPIPSNTTRWEDIVALQRRTIGDDLEVRQFIYDSPHIATLPTLAELAHESFAPGRPWLEANLDLTARIHRDFAYDATATSVSTPLADVLAMRRGVCQDFAHLQIGCLRSLGLPARYVSGYLLTTPPPGQPRLIGADASHAWVSAWCPELGWVDFDPTNNLIPSLEHITVAWGRDYSDVCPIKGVFLGGGEHSMSVSVDVEPLTDSPNSAPG